MSTTGPLSSHGHSPLPHSTAWYSLSRIPFSHLARLPVHVRKVVDMVLYAQPSPHLPNLPGLSPLFCRLPHLSSSEFNSSVSFLGDPPGLVRSPVKCFDSGPSFLSRPSLCKVALRCDGPAIPALSLHLSPTVAWPAGPRTQPTVLVRGLATAAQSAAGQHGGGGLEWAESVWLGLLTEAQLEKGSRTSQWEATGVPQGWKLAGRGPVAQLPPFSSSTGTAPTSPTPLLQLVLSRGCHGIHVLSWTIVVLVG